MIRIGAASDSPRKRRSCASWRNTRRATASMILRLFRMLLPRADQAEHNFFERLFLDLDPRDRRVEPVTAQNFGKTLGIVVDGFGHVFTAAPQVNLSLPAA